MPRHPDPSGIFTALTSKQHEVLALVADHRTSKEIAVELGISESAVNQRIEAVRARLGGPPRARMARDYRLYASENAQQATYKKLPWQRFQLPAAQQSAQVATAESVSDRVSGRLDQDRDGLQLSANSPDLSLTSGSQSAEQAPAVLILAMIAIVLAGMAAAYFVTLLIGIG